jgi:hypothetical protein
MVMRIGRYIRISKKENYGNCWHIKKQVKFKKRVFGGIEEYRNFGNCYP